jgi:hypothetical protein
LATGAGDALKTHRENLLPYAALLFLSSLAFVHLMVLPPFQDEGSQMRWVWRLISAWDWRSTLKEGKPLEAWLVAPLALAGFAPLPAARTLHVLAGMLGAVLTYRLALKFADRPAAFVSACLFAICPFVVYLQRLALSDIFLCTAGIWVLLSIVTLLRSPTWSHSCVTAIALAVAALCKLPVGFIFVASMPLALLFMPAAERRVLLRQPESTRLLAAYAPVLLLMLIVTVAAIIQVRGGHAPAFGVADLFGIGLGHYQSIANVIGVPRSTLLGELTAQLSLPVVIVSLLGIGGGALFGDWRYRWLIAVGLMPMLAIAWLTEFWFPRYLLFTLPPLIIAAVAGWELLCMRARRLRRPAELTALAVCIVFMGRESALIVLKPIAANWSAVDRAQYIEGGGSGYGYPEAAHYLLQAQNVPQLIFSLDGHSAFQLLTYLPTAWNGRVRPIAYGDDGEELSTQEGRLDNLLHHAPVWIVAPDPVLQTYLEATFGLPRLNQIILHPVARFDKPGGREQLALYEATRR